MAPNTPRISHGDLKELVTLTGFQTLPVKEKRKEKGSAHDRISSRFAACAGLSQPDGRTRRAASMIQPPFEMRDALFQRHTYMYTG